MQQESTRKRPRPSRRPPQPQHQQRITRSDEDMIVQRLNDGNDRTAALNSLLELSSSSNNVNFFMTSDAILKSLVQVVFELLEWDNDCIITTTDNTKLSVFNSHKTWQEYPSECVQKWTLHFVEKVSHIDTRGYQTLHAIMIILRNFSFVSANYRLILYSTDIMHILLAALYEPMVDNPARFETSSTANNATSATNASDDYRPQQGALAGAALTTLVHLAPTWDLSGQAYMVDQLFYNYNVRTNKEGPAVPDKTNLVAPAAWGLGGAWIARKFDTKEDIMEGLPTDYIMSLAGPYLVSVWSLFRALSHVLCNTAAPRLVTMSALDLLQVLSTHARIGVVGSVAWEDNPDKLPTLRATLVHMPDTLITRLVDLLYVSRSSSTYPDGLEYSSYNPLNNIVTRVVPMRLLAGYDSMIDNEVRDRVLELLVPLLELDSPNMALRLGLRDYIVNKNDDDDDNDNSDSTFLPRTLLWDSLIPALTTDTGRNEASTWAMQILRELAKAPFDEIGPGLLYVKSRLVSLASRDGRIANLVWNQMYIDGKNEESV